MNELWKASRREIVLLVSLALISALFTVAGRARASDRNVAIQADLPSNSVPGERPYEFVWSGRKESPPAQIAFDDLHGWTMTVTGDSDAKVSLSASNEHLLFRNQLAKFTYSGGKTDVSAIIRPPKPVLINGRFDAANLWVCAGWMRQFRGADKQAPQLRVYLQDSAGEEFTMNLGTLASGYWDLKHGILRPNQLADATFPMYFEGIELRNWNVSGERTLYLESLAFYQQDRKQGPYVRPAHPIFPTSDEGMLPTPAPGASTLVSKKGTGAEFICKARNGVLHYIVNPAEGLLNGVTAQWNDGHVIRPMSGGGIKIDTSDNVITVSENDMGKVRSYAEMNTGEALKANTNSNGILSQPNMGRVVGTQLKNGHFAVRWRLDELKTPVEWRADYWIKGCTLVVDVTCSGGSAEGIKFGSFQGLSNPRTFWVPYFVLTRNSTMLDGPWWIRGDGLFASVLPDIYHSDLSDLDAKPDPQQGDGVGLIGSTSYVRLTDGRRNDLHDRILVSVSPEFQDTLPNARNPVSPNRERYAPNVVFLSYGVDLNALHTFKRYGMDHIMANIFGYLYSSGDQAPTISDPTWNFAARWRPRPPMTVATLQDYRKQVKSLGYLFGSYFYSLSLATTNEFFDEKDVALTSSGEWIAGDDSQIGTKMAATVKLTRLAGEKIKKYYPPDIGYVDIGSCVAVGNRDYEAGIPGAGKSYFNMLAHGDSLVEARKWFGGTMCEGYLHWFYGGLSDIDYGSQIAPVPYFLDASSFGMDPDKTPGRADIPQLVDFDLLKNHPRAHATMMGFCPIMYLSGKDWYALLDDKGAGAAPIGFYKWLSASIAYGHMGMLGYDYEPPLSRCVQLYSLMQAVQNDYLRDNVADISYHNGTAFVSTSQALLDDTVKMGRIRVRYLKGLTVQVNLNPTENWTVEVAGHEFVLPPYGWVVDKGGKVIAFSALVNGSRLDYVSGPEYTYLNTCGVPSAEGPVFLNGAVMVKPETGALRVIPCGDLGPWQVFSPEGWSKDLTDRRLSKIPADRGCSGIVLDVRSLLKKSASQVDVQGHDEAGNILQPDVKVLDDSRIQIAPSAQVVDYILR